MDPSSALITKLVDNGAGINEVLREGIRPHNLNEDSGAILGYIERHFSEYKKVPGRDAIRLAFPGFEFRKAPEPLEYYVAAVKESLRRNIIEPKLEVLADVYSRDTREAEALLRELLGELTITKKSFKDVDLVDSVEDRLEAYALRKECPGMDGIPSNWNAMDYYTLGWHAGEFVVLCAEKYMGKSWTMIYLALQAALAGEKVLFITKEMSQDAVTRRFDSIFAQVKFHDLRRGELSAEAEKRYKAKMRELADSNIQFVVARHGVNTIEDIQFKAVETDATIIFGDSIYLFDPDSRRNFAGETARRLAVSQRCKELAQELGVPFIVSVQAGRKKTKEQAPSLDSIEWSNAFSQDGDIVFFLDRNELDKEIGRSHMWLLKCRDGDINDFYTNWDFDYMDFSEREDDTSPSTDVFEEDDEVMSFDE